MLQLFVAAIMLAALIIADERALRWALEQWSLFQQRLEDK